MLGLDTSAAVLTFTMYLVAKHPRVQAKLQDEVDAVLSGDVVDDDKICSKLLYTRNVVKEVCTVHVERRQ